MISVYLREQKRYTQKELLKIFVCSEEKLDLIFSKLKEFGILKIVRKSSSQLNMSNLVDEYIEIVPVEAICKDCYYVFIFVGILIVAGRILVNVNIRMYNFDDVQCTVIPSVAYGFVTGMNLQLC